MLIIKKKFLNKDPNYFELLSDEKFQYRFRLSKKRVKYLLIVLNGEIDAATDR